MYPRLLRHLLTSSAILFFISGTLACTWFGGRPLRCPVQFSETPTPHGENLFPNWQSPPYECDNQLYQLLVTEQYQINKKRPTRRGTSGAYREIVHFPTIEKDVMFKWKEAPREELDHFNNSPRREIAAYQIQKLFLDPEDYVVPSTFALCVPLDIYEKYGEPTSASIEGTNCVIGVGSIWMMDVKIPEVLYEQSRYLTEPNYAYFMSNLNLFTYLIAHRDARQGNFLVSQDEERRQVFSVDNGESFGSFPYNFFVRNWDVIIVPALRKDSTERLRKIQREDLDFLGVVVQFKKDERGVLLPVPAGDNLDPQKGVRIYNDTLQLGLTKSEIDDIWERIQDVVADVDSCKIPVF